MFLTEDIQQIYDDDPDFGPVSAPISTNYGSVQPDFGSVQPDFVPDSNVKTSYGSLKTFQPTTNYGSPGGKVFVILNYSCKVP